MNLNLISVIIAAIVGASGIYFATRNMRNQIKEQDDRYSRERENRQRKEIDKAVEDAKRHTEIVEMLKALSDDTKENKNEITRLRDEVKTLNDNQIRNIRDLKTAFERIEKIETRLELLHKEHRERAGTCINN